MPRLKLTIAYVGTQYHGWQTQARKNASPLPTIQNIIEDAVAHVLGERVHVHGAGRTDAGVHAEAQVAHLDVPESRARMDWQLALNTSCRATYALRTPFLCPTRSTHSTVPSARPTNTASGSPSATRRRSSILSSGPAALWMWSVWTRGAATSLGKSGLRQPEKTPGRNLRTTVRTILSITRTPEGPLPEGCLELTWRFEADGFLKQMVRNTMGLLVAVGRGSQPADIPGILDACNRRIAPLTAPACGLTMKKVWYDDMFPLAASGHEGA